MNIHKNARTTPHSRAEIARRVILEGQPPGAVAAAFGVCLKTVGKWVTRFEASFAIALHRVSGHGNDWNMSPGFSFSCTNNPCRIETVKQRHLEVHQNQIKSMFR